MRRISFMTVPGTLFEAIGGYEPIDRLIEGLYKRIGQHPKLTPIFPDDLEESARKQRLFLIQFLGGPPLYTEDRGHPMLRRRHLAFAITPERKDAWLECMNGALEEAGIKDPYRTAIFDRLTMTAQHMVNTPE